jgi:cytoskeletal protein CcmA (bactofilin family)
MTDKMSQMKLHQTKDKAEEAPNKRNGNKSQKIRGKAKHSTKLEFHSDVAGKMHAPIVDIRTEGGFGDHARNGPVQGANLDPEKWRK